MAAPIEVSAALVFHDGQLLITRRPDDSHLGGLWEFPGGKREPGETFEQCLDREIQEELGMKIAVGTLFSEIIHSYGEKTVHLKFFICRRLAGEPRAIACPEFKWIRKDDLPLYKFPEADSQLLNKLAACDFAKMESQAD